MPGPLNAVPLDTEPCFSIYALPLICLSAGGGSMMMRLLSLALGSVFWLYGWIRAAEVSAAEIRAAEIRAAVVRSPNVTAAEVRSPEVLAAEVRVPTINVAEVRAARVRSPEIRAPDVPPRKIYFTGYESD